ncbi:MAG: YhgE/Pip family protein, partial [Eubacterium sp.]|nr:YhgE/Pip family protein [Eubacterium sp.]
MAIILVIGVALLPSLYAWFNIYANWDPYGSTGNMQVAVVNSDTGTVIKDIDVCIGEQIVSNLKSNNSIDWQFVSKEEAIDGVKSGKYYAAVEIPENFSSSLTSILTTEFIQPKITYYANEKKNAIATKITDKVVTTVQTQVNESFVSTVVDVLSQVFGIISDDVSAADENLFATLTEQIHAAKASVDVLDSTLSGFAETSKLIKELGADINSYDFSSLNSNTNAAINNTSDAINMMQNSMNGITDTVGVFLGDIDKDVNSAAVSINNAADRINEIKSDETINAELNNAYDKCTDIALQTESVSSALSRINNSLPKPLSELDELIQRLNNVAEIADKTASDINMVIKHNSKETDFTDITLKLNNISNEIKTVSDDYNNTVKQQMDKTVSSLLVSLKDASDMLSLIDKDKEKIDTIL